MIYQEMYGYLTIEDPKERDKAWKSLSPQVRDYLYVFLDLMNQAQENVYYEKSKFYRLITADEFENLRLVYFKMESKDIVIDAAFEEEFKQAFIAYEKKAAMKAKMNQWRAEMAKEEEVEPTPDQQQEPVFYNKQRMVDQDDMVENTRNYIPQNSGSSSGMSTGGCLIAIVSGLLILLALYWWTK
jgi:hypothetical protein